MTQTRHASTDKLDTHLRALTQGIGVRLAGSDAEQQAAEYVREHFVAAGVEVSLEPFPVKERSVQREELRVRLGDRWESFPCSLFSSTPGTEGQAIEAPLCFFEAAAEYRRKDFSHLTGKAVLHLGCHIESREDYRQLMAAKPAFLMLVDVRYPGVLPLADGMFPSYAQALGAVPTVNVAYMDAWRWKVEKASAARLVVEGGMRNSTSQNVLAELPGTSAAGELLFCGGHHDTQAGSVGADDNASGTVALLELARLLAPLPRKRTIRLISFGAEEQLSVGSAVYVRRHRTEVQSSGRFMFNLDSYASHLGWTELNCNGPKALTEHLLRHFDRAGLYARPAEGVVPYTDQFPFAAAGVPGVYLGRHNCTAGRFFHHRADDDMTRISVPLIAAWVDAVAALIAELADAECMPFDTHIPTDQQAGIEAFWEDLYGGWEGLK